MDFQVWRLWGVNRHFGGPIEEKVSDLAGLEGLEAWKWVDFQVPRLWDVSRGNVQFGGPIEEEVSDLGGLEGVEGLEMH